MALMEGLYHKPGEPDTLVPMRLSEEGFFILGAATGNQGSSSDSTEVTQLAVQAAVEQTSSVLGAKDDTSASTDTGTFSLVALVKRMLGKQTSILSKLPDQVSACVPVTNTQKVCTGQQQLNVGPSPALLFVPANSVSAKIQAEGGAIRISLNSTNPSDTFGMLINDGQTFVVDSNLAIVKLYATNACKAQVVYFDKV